VSDLAERVGSRRVGGQEGKKFSVHTLSEGIREGEDLDHGAKGSPPSNWGKKRLSLGERNGVGGRHFRRLPAPKRKYRD